MTELAIPEPGPERLRFVDERLALAGRTRREGSPERATELVVEALRAGLWSHSRLWSELLYAMAGKAYPLIRTLWLDSPRRCHRDLSIIRVVARAAGAAAEHDDARSLLRKAILRQGYRRRRLRSRARRLARVTTRALRGPAGDGRYATALAGLTAALTEVGARPFLIGETLRRHTLGTALGAPLATGELRLELGVLAAELAPDKLDQLLRESPWEARRLDPRAEVWRVGHAAGVSAGANPGVLSAGANPGVKPGVLSVDISLHRAGGDGRIWREGPAVRWWYAAFGFAPVDVLGGAGFVPDPPERYLSQSYPDWRVVADDFDPHLDAPNVEVTDPELFETLDYAALLDSLTGNHRPLYRRYLGRLAERGEGGWLGRLRLGAP